MLKGNYFILECNLHRNFNSMYQFFTIATCRIHEPTFSHFFLTHPLLLFDPTHSGQKL